MFRHLVLSHHSYLSIWIFSIAVAIQSLLYFLQLLGLNLLLFFWLALFSCTLFRFDFLNLVCIKEDIEMEDILVHDMEGIKKVLIMVRMGKLATIVEEETRTSRWWHVRYWSRRWWRHLLAICKCCCCLFVFSLLYKWRTFRSIMYRI